MEIKKIQTTSVKGVIKKNCGCNGLRKKSVHTKPVSKPEIRTIRPSTIKVQDNIKKQQTNTIHTSKTIADKSNTFNHASSRNKAISTLGSNAEISESIIRLDESLSKIIENFNNLKSAFKDFQG